MTSSNGMMKFPAEWKVIIHSCSSHHQPDQYVLKHVLALGNKWDLLGILYWSILFVGVVSWEVVGDFWTVSIGRGILRTKILGQHDFSLKYRGFLQILASNSLFRNYQQPINSCFPGQASNRNKLIASKMLRIPIQMIFLSNLVYF